MYKYARIRLSYAFAMLVGGVGVGRETRPLVPECLIPGDLLLVDRSIIGFQFQFWGRASALA